MLNFHKEVNSFLVLDCMGEEQKTPNSFYGPVARKNYIIHYVISGCGYFNYEGNTRRVSAGQSFIIHPNKIAHYWADTNDPWHYIWIEFNGSGVENLLSKTRFSLTAPVCESIPSQEIYPFFYNALQAHKAFDIPDVRNSYLYSILAQYIKFIPSEKGLFPHNNKLSYQILNYMDCHYMENQLNIQKIADFFNISRSQLFRVFKQTFGISPIEYMLFLRIEQAKMILSLTDLSVNQISQYVGFNDAKYFTQIFIKKVGIPPTEYRKQNGENLDSTIIPPPLTIT